MSKEDPSFINGYCATFTGKMIVPDEPKPEDIDIIDIAVGLSQQCRYAGHVWPFYSVAEHSILVAQLVGQQPDDKRYALRALMHDSPEFILNDKSYGGLGTTPGRVQIRNTISACPDEIAP